MQQTRILLHAPNVHIGGGVVLLKALLEAWPAGTALVAILDQRAQSTLSVPPHAQVHWVRPSIGSRLHAEFLLRRASQAGDSVLCFHGLPPLLPNRATVTVFLQNRLLIERGSLARHAPRVAVRLAIERALCRWLRRRSGQYIVQSPSMRRALMDWYGDPGIESAPKVQVLPFASTPPFAPREAGDEAKFDFVYVADGQAHKNHHNLLAAWALLAAEGLRPTLALTLDPSSAVLRQGPPGAVPLAQLPVTPLGTLSHEQVLALYTRAGALIFPSTTESLGLPLIEASSLGLPILAPELDYVRDVCTPVQTFDPQSPTSIARAVKRFLGLPSEPVRLHPPADFWKAVLAAPGTR